MANFHTHYDNLKVACNAPDSVIKVAYKALMQQYHPDKFEGTEKEALRITKLIMNSYEVLIDPVRRAAHDHWIDEQRQTNDGRGYPIQSSTQENSYSSNSVNQKDINSSMTFGQSIAISLSKFFVFSGRASRAEYLWWVLFMILMSLIARLIPSIFTVSTVLALHIPWLSVTTRRLHDTNHSGWMQLIPLTIIGIIPFLIWSLSKGDRHRNKYGEPSTGKANQKQTRQQENTPPPESNVLWYKPGDTLSDGSVVFHVEQSGTYGLAAKAEDEKGELHWDAAKFKAGTNWADWHLPTKKELSLLYQQKSVVGGFTNACYWSSTVYESNMAWCMNFDNSNQITRATDFRCRVRSIRSFSNEKTLPPQPIEAPYKLGDVLTDGSIVFHVDVSGRYGLLAQPADSTRNTTWDEANQTAKGYGQDWRLPTKEESVLLYKARGIVGGLHYANYWNSTEYDRDNAWSQYFIFGNQNYFNKRSLLSV